MKKVMLGFLAFLVILVIAFLAGPKPDAPNFQAPTLDFPQGLAEMEVYVKAHEAQVPDIKPDNASRIIWADSTPQLTDYAVLYLHGFSASPEEGLAMAESFARRYHCNLYLPRLQGHGLDRAEPMLEVTAEGLYASAAEGLALTRRLGKKVIVMATSTGGTLCLKLASEQADLAGIILYSPNIKVFDPMAAAITYPWGLTLAQNVKGSKYHEFSEIDDYSREYWTPKYRLEAIQQLQLLLDNTMKPETFKAVQQPLFLAYYYQNEELQDHTVSIEAMLKMYDQLSTPENKKRKQAFPEAGAHVLANPNTSGAYEEVKSASFSFAEEVLGLSPWSAPQPELAPEK